MKEKYNRIKKVKEVPAEITLQEIKHLSPDEIEKILHDLQVHQ